MNLIWVVAIGLGLEIDLKVYVAFSVLARPGQVAFFRKSEEAFKTNCAQLVSQRAINSLNLGSRARMSQASALVDPFQIYSQWDNQFIGTGCPYERQEKESKEGKHAIMLQKEYRMLSRVQSSNKNATGDRRSPQFTMPPPTKEETYWMDLANHQPLSRERASTLACGGVLSG
jgi:hypothetical protein